MDRFAIRDVVEVPKLGLKALRLRHKGSKLTHLHVQRPDPNMVFALAFKTDAPDHTGVPHILEHTALCGSKMFPVRDPFFKMQTRSLANFMNAMTGPDYTYYPFATTNKTDFLNLQRIYMDSVFSPMLREQDFLQEGWRLENEKVEDKDSPITFKGVVYNEMKGQMSMPAYYFYINWMLSIYPSMQYSGGDPAFIPQLKYEDLVKFHHEKYHPDNCFTFSYGNFDSSEAVAQLSEYLDSVRPGEGIEPGVNREVPQPIKLENNTQVVAKGPVDPMFDESKQQKASLTWYVGESTDFMHSLSWRVLGQLLTDGHASPFYQSLIDAGIGPEFSVNTGVEETPGKIMFTIGLQGLSEDKVGEFKNAVFETLNKLINEGFAQQRVDAILHQAELSDREIDANFGLSLLSRVVSRAFHANDDVMDTLDNEKLLEKFKSRYSENPKLFQDELAKMRDSPLFEYVMKPDAKFEELLQAKEQDRLASAVESLDEEGRKHIWEQGRALAAAQNEKQDLEILPKVDASDIAPRAIEYPVKKTSLRGTSLLLRETPTQGLSYLRIRKDMSSIPVSLWSYLPIYASALTNVGTSNHNMAELEDLIKLHTGGIHASGSTRHRFGEPNGFVLGLSASGLDSKLPQIYSLLEEVITQPLLNNVSKLKSILEASAGSIMDVMSQQGHSYAMSQACAAVRPLSAASERLSGLSYVRLLKTLSSFSEEQLTEELVPKLQQLHSVPWNAQAGLTCTSGVSEDHTPHLNKLLQQLNSKTESPSTLSDVDLCPAKSHVALPFQVSYVGAAVAGPSYFTKQSAALQILSSLLTHKHLHTEIREKGGAYGGGARFNAQSGLFTMYSYRDPSPENTLHVIQNAGKWAAQQSWTENDVEEGKLSVFQGVDSPISPRSEISFALDSNLSDAQRQQRRELLLGVSAADLNAVAEQYLGDLQTLDNVGVAVLGPADVDQSWTKITV